MSHNKIKVGGQEPDASGDITLSLDNLNDVDTSGVSNDEILQYAGGSWGTTTAPASVSNYILIGQGEPDSYSNSGASNLNSGSFIRLYDTSPINTIAGASFTSSSDWISLITLPAGNYFIQSQVRVVFSASGHLLFNLSQSDGTRISNSALVGDNASTYIEGASSSLQSFVSLSSSTDLMLKVANPSNVDSVANQGTIIGEYSFLLIVKIG